VKEKTCGSSFQGGSRYHHHQLIRHHHYREERCTEVHRLLQSHHPGLGPGKTAAAVHRIHRECCWTADRRSLRSGRKTVVVVDRRNPGFGCPDAAVAGCGSQRLKDGKLRNRAGHGREVDLRCSWIFSVANFLNASIVKNYLYV